MFLVLHLAASDIALIFILLSFFLVGSNIKNLMNLFLFLELKNKRTQKTLLHSMKKWQDVSGEIKYIRNSAAHIFIW